MSEANDKLKQAREKLDIVSKQLQEAFPADVDSAAASGNAAMCTGGVNPQAFNAWRALMTAMHRWAALDASVRKEHLKWLDRKGDS